MAKAAEVKFDVHASVTESIIRQLEAGTSPWVKPWGSPVSSRPLRHNGVPYTGINVLLLWSAAMEHGYSANHWMTYKQAEELGGQVRKGEKSSLVVYAGAIEKTEETQAGESVERRIPFMKAYRVFNADQIDGLPEQYRFQPVEKLAAETRLCHVDAFFEATGADIREGGNQAFYHPVKDYVQMPDFQTFATPEDYASTLAHEMVHWTSAEKRLARSFEQKRFGDEGYAREELVAEIGAAFLCADLAIENKGRADHAAYIASWITVLKNDKRAIFQAASYAEKAAEFLHSFRQSAELAA
ncbi:zincin-like metallopeptidase domain-containing protein [Allorhizobium sp. BGMRC 0089]|uniref:ArdC family protein n=1 Tax=Allorhizobium sonneratiae TaxID=2934936 RepID=UPI002033A865|nr:zincin-like metallopeptidase domain-containing protein [Allorhizobium sonneratiae]MCM2294788.1 zincin-like metallopeptidase domain-containing protein [Allorhizobium sonneratiae]